MEAPPAGAVVLISFPFFGLLSLEAPSGRCAGTCESRRFRALSGDKQSVCGSNCRRANGGELPSGKFVAGELRTAGKAIYGESGLVRRASRCVERRGA
jgi:hypothetical protein